MRLLILPGTYDLLNLGDVAMLEIALERLRGLWPGARFDVLTHKPRELVGLFPEVHPVLLKGRNRWLKMRSLPRIVFPAVSPERRRAFPVTLANCWKLGIIAWPGQFKMVRPFVSAMFKADMVIMTGCGVVADPFHFNGLRILDMFRVAMDVGIRTAMVGQGIGPLETPELFARCQEVLPRLDRLCIRESLHTASWLRRAGVPDQTVRVTGDDAVELAFRHRSSPGAGLGINLRMASYSQLGTDVAAVVRSAVKAVANEFGCHVIGLPVLTGDAPNGDVATLGRVLPDRLEALAAAANTRTPADLARQVAACRLVVAGSYHAGVFALAQGIPVVAIAESGYYREKFSGLAAQFGDGCVVLNPQEPTFAEQLTVALKRLWSAAPGLRDNLLRSGESQIAAGHAAYSELKQLAALPLPA